MRYGFFKDASFEPQSNFCTKILPLEFCQVGQFKDYRFLLILISLLLAGPRLFRYDTLTFSASNSKIMHYGLLKDASFDSQENFYTCILRLEFCQVGKFEDYRFLLILISLFLAGPRLFSDVTHCRFWPRIPKVCVMPGV